MDGILLFPKDVDRFTSGSYGELSEATKCEVTQSLNGEYELELEYPISGKLYSVIELDAIIYTRVNLSGNDWMGSDRQAFRIYEITRPINGIVSIKGQHLRYDLSGYYINPITTEITSSGSLCGIINSRMPDGWIFDNHSTGVTIQNEITTTTPKSILSVIAGDEISLTKTFGLTVRWSNYYVSVWDPVPNTNIKAVIRYGDDLTEYSRVVKNDNMYTEVYPFFYYESDSGGQLYELPEKTISTGVIGGIPKTYLLDLSSAWANDKYSWRDEYPTVEEMREATADFITENKLGVPVDSLTISFVQKQRLKRSPGDEFEAVKKLDLGDYVKVEFPRYGSDVVLQVTKIVYDAIGNKIVSMELGDESSSLSSGISLSQSLTQNAVNAINGSVAEINATNINTRNLTANVAQINTLLATDAIIQNIRAQALTADYIDAQMGSFGYLKAGDITATFGTFHYLSTSSLNATYANIGLANLDMAQVQKATIHDLFVKGEYVEDVTSSGVTTQYLRGVKIEGDVIEANTISAKSLIIRRENSSGDYMDGLIWQINAQSGELTQQQLTEEQYRKKLDGTDLVAHSVTAREITTERLVGSTGYIQIGANGPNMNLGNKFIYENGVLSMNMNQISLIASADYFGGTNLVLGTSNTIADGMYAPYGDDYKYYVYNLRGGLKYGTYTFSANIRRSNGDATYCSIAIYDDSVTTQVALSNAYIEPDNNRTSCKFTIESANSYVGTKLLIYCGPQGATGGNGISFYAVKLEKGEIATNWSPAPEDIDTNIETSVSYVQGVKYLTGQNQSTASINDIISTCAEGNTAQWYVMENTANIRNGDTVYILRTTSEVGNVYCKGTVTSKTTYGVTCTMHGYEVVRPSDNPIAYINMQPDTIKIAANHVDIEGSVTFQNLSSEVVHSNKKYTFLVDLNGYDENTWYPVIAKYAVPSTEFLEFGAVTSLDDYSHKPSWAQHPSGFVVMCRAKYKGGGWGTSDGAQYCTENSYSWITDGLQPAYAMGQFNYGSNPIFLCRGGGHYYMESPVNIDWSVILTSSDISNGYGWWVTPTGYPPNGIDGNTSPLLKPSRDIAASIWAAGEDVTQINGGRIYTNSIKARSIDVTDLFAQNITATGNISGATITSGSFTSTSDGYGGRINLSSGGIRYSSSYVGGYGLKYDGFYGLYAQGTVSRDSMNLTNTSLVFKNYLSDFENSTVITYDKITTPEIATGSIIENGSRLSDIYASYNYINGQGGYRDGFLRSGGSVNVPPGAYTNLCNMFLPSDGMYIVYGVVEWAEGNTTDLSLMFSQSASGGPWDGYACNRMWVNTAGKVSQSVFTIIMDGGWTLYLNAYRNGGGTSRYVNKSSLMAVKIGRSISWHLS